MLALSWLVAKAFFKKAWVWIKNYWYVPALLLYTLIMWIVFRKNSDDILKVLEISKESYKKQLEVVNKSHEDEIKKRDNLILEYHDSLKKIEEEYKIKLSDLDNKKKEEVVKIVEENKDTPDVLAKELSRLLGADYVE